MQSGASRPGRWKRPQPTAIGPDRSFGGYYRTADRTLNGKQFRGVPLRTAEDAAVAAVRLGYGVVDAQITRGLDMARRLRGAADRAGVSATGDVLDTTEDLFTRGLLVGFELLESAASDPASPVRRLLTAQFRLMASLLGLKFDGADAEPRTKQPEKRTRTHAEKATVTKHPEVEYSRTSTRPNRHVRIRHQGDLKKAVRIVRWEVAPSVRPASAARDVRFHLASGLPSPQIEGRVIIAPREDPVLEIALADTHPAGRWRAAICEANGEQVGIVEIVL